MHIQLVIKWTTLSPPEHNCSTPQWPCAKGEHHKILPIPPWHHLLNWSNMSLQQMQLQPLLDQQQHLQQLQIDQPQATSAANKAAVAACSTAASDKPSTEIIRAAENPNHNTTITTSIFSLEEKEQPSLIPPPMRTLHSRQPLQISLPSCPPL